MTHKYYIIIYYNYNNIDKRVKRFRIKKKTKNKNELLETRMIE